MKYLTLALLLTACGDSVNLGVVDVAPETKTCQDTLIVVGRDSVYRDIQPPRECKTGGVRAKWIWE